MSRPSPYTMTIGEDGLSVRYEWEAHYLTDEQLETVRKHVETLQRMNVLLREENGRLQIESGKLRELVRDMWGFIEGTDEDCGDVTFSSCFDYCKHDTADDGCNKTGECWYEQRMSELGVVE